MVALAGAAYIAVIILSIVSLVFGIIVSVQMIKHDQQGLGITCIILSFCTGIGTLIAFVYGWIKAAEWDIKKLMMAWTVCFLLMIGAVGVMFVAGVMGAAEMNNQMQNELNNMNFEDTENGFDVEFGTPDGEMNIDFNTDPSATDTP